MIYLIRGTEIAVLEGAGGLDRYRADGWRVVTWDEYRVAWRAKSTDMAARLTTQAPPLLRWCPECAHQLARRLDGSW